MAVNPHLATIIKAGTTYYRITSPQFNTKASGHHRKIVNGQGAARNSHGSRYAYPHVVTVYVSDDLETCLAERMFYFHREVIPKLDQSHVTGVIPPFHMPGVLWEVEFRNDIADVADLTAAANAFGIFPSLMLNPSQDYLHLKEARARIQGLGYAGLLAPSSRTRSGGRTIVIFSDQSRNVASIRPHPFDVRLICRGNPTLPFTNHVTDILEFTSGEFLFHGAPPIAGTPRAGWIRVEFNH